MILETAVGPSQKAQDFESESHALGVYIAQTVKATPEVCDYGSKDCAFRPAPTAVSRMIDIAISPCPNDTFLFGGWINGKIQSPLVPKVTFADIQTLNQMARAGQIAVIKMSCFGFAKVAEQYKLLPVGAAIGNFGPKLIAKKPFDLSKLSEKTVAIPGKDTTAYLLLQSLCPAPKQVLEVTYDTITTLVANDKVDAGLIIHETRLTFQDLGLFEICDLGELFLQKFGLAVPLGVVCIRKDLDETEVILAMRKSLTHAKMHPDYDFISSHSQEKNLEVIKAHIATYVNDETYQLSKTGLQSIQTLFTLAYEKGLLAKIHEDFCICDS